MNAAKRSSTLTQATASFLPLSFFLSLSFSSPPFVLAYQSLSELSIMNNDISVLEQLHAATTSRLLSREGTNILSGLKNPTAIRDIRKLIVKNIMGTDMKNHFSQVKKANDFGEAMTATDNTEFICEFVLHCCDIGAQTFPTDTAARWSVMILTEFRAQVSDEQELGIPVTGHMAKLDTPMDIARVQGGFIEYIVQPCWRALQLGLPKVKIGLDNLQANLERESRPLVEAEAKEREKEAAAAAADAASADYDADTKDGGGESSATDDDAGEEAAVDADKGEKEAAAE